MPAPWHTGCCKVNRTQGAAEARLKAESAGPAKQTAQTDCRTDWESGLKCRNLTIKLSACGLPQTEWSASISYRALESAFHTTPCMASTLVQPFQSSKP